MADRFLAHALVRGMTHYPRLASCQAALDVVKPLLADHCEILTPAAILPPRAGTVPRPRPAWPCRRSFSSTAQCSAANGKRSPRASTLTDTGLAPLVTRKPEHRVHDAPAGQLTPWQARRPHGPILAGVTTGRRSMSFGP